MCACVRSLWSAQRPLVSAAVPSTFVFSPAQAAHKDIKERLAEPPAKVGVRCCPAPANWLHASSCAVQGAPSLLDTICSAAKTTM